MNIDSQKKQQVAEIDHKRRMRELYNAYLFLDVKSICLHVAIALYFKIDNRSVSCNQHCSNCLNVQFDDTDRIVDYYHANSVRILLETIQVLLEFYPAVKYIPVQALIYCVLGKVETKSVDNRLNFLLHLKEFGRLIHSNLNVINALLATMRRMDLVGFALCKEVDGHKIFEEVPTLTYFDRMYDTSFDNYHIFIRDTETSLADLFVYNSFAGNTVTAIYLNQLTLHLSISRYIFHICRLSLKIIIRRISLLCHAEYYQVRSLIFTKKILDQLMKVDSIIAFKTLVDHDTWATVIKPEHVIERIQLGLYNCVYYYKRLIHFFDHPADYLNPPTGLRCPYIDTVECCNFFSNLANLLATPLTSYPFLSKSAQVINDFTLASFHYVRDPPVGAAHEPENLVRHLLLAIGHLDMRAQQQRFSQFLSEQYDEFLVERRELCRLVADLRQSREAGSRVGRYCNIEIEFIVKMYLRLGVFYDFELYDRVKEFTASFLAEKVHRAAASIISLVNVALLDKVPRYFVEDIHLNFEEHGIVSRFLVAVRENYRVPLRRQ